MVIKSIIVKLEKRAFASSIENTQWVIATTIDANKIVFWGSEEFSVNLLTLTQQQLPMLVHCNQCEKVETKCTYQEDDYFSVPEDAIVTVYPYKPEKINYLLNHGYRKNELVDKLTHFLQQ